MSFIILIICSFFQQINETKSYLSHYQNNSAVKHYEVAIITINPDSTYQWMNYNVGTKQNWKNYRKVEPSISRGSIRYNNGFYELLETRNGQISDLIWRIRISKKRLELIWNMPDGKTNKSTVFKAIENE